MRAHLVARLILAALVVALIGPAVALVAQSPVVLPAPFLAAGDLSVSSVSSSARTYQVIATIAEIPVGATPIAQGDKVSFVVRNHGVSGTVTEVYRYTDGKRIRYKVAVPLKGPDGSEVPNLARAEIRRATVFTWFRPGE